MTSDIVLHPDDRLELQVGEQAVEITALPGGTVRVDIPGGQVRADTVDVRAVDAAGSVTSRLLSAEHVHADRTVSDQVSAREDVDVGHRDPDTEQPGRVVVRGSDGEAEALVLDGAESAIDVGPGGALRLGVGASIVRRFFRLPEVDDFPGEGPTFEGFNHRTGRYERFGDGGNDDEEQWEEVDLFDQLETLERELADLRNQVAAMRDGGG